MLSRVLPILLLFFLSPMVAEARSSKAEADSAAARAQEATPLIVDSIEIDNRNIYDTSDPEYDNFFFHLANRLHRKTRRHVVEREVLLEVGAPYSSDLADETARNLRERLPIYDAYVYTDTLPNGRLLVRVVTIDQWSLSGGASLRREANETSYWVGATERNFLGLNQYISATYYVESDEDDHSQVYFYDNRILGRPLALSAGYSNDPLSSYQLLALAHPYYKLDQRFSMDASVTNIGGRRDVYDNDRLIAQSEYDGEQFQLGCSIRAGTYLEKGYLAFSYKYHREVTTARYYLDPANHELADRHFPVDSLYHQIRLTTGLARLNFVALRQIDGFGYTEDFGLGSAVALSLTRAMNPDSVVHNAFGMALAQSSKLRIGLVSLAGAGNIWLHRDETLRRQFYLTGRLYNSDLDFFTLAMRFDYLSDWRYTRTDNLELGGDQLRGFDRHFRTGDRRAVLNVEGRVFPGLELLSVIFGGVAFVDLGRTYRSGEDLTLRGFYASVGVGLRVSFERTSRRSLFRCDLAYSEHNGWQVSLSSGQFFDATRDVLALTSR